MNIVQRWTQSAIDCYERRCICSGCSIYEQIKDECKMKETVIELVRVLGLPVRTERNEDEAVQRIILGLKEGKTRQELADELNMEFKDLQNLMQRNNLTLRSFKQRSAKKKRKDTKWT